MSYTRGAWDALSFVLNHLNTYETRSILKKDLYSELLAITPADVGRTTIGMGPYMELDSMTIPATTRGATMKLYIAGQSQYREEIAGIIQSLRARNYEVISNWPWLDVNSTATDEARIWDDIVEQIAECDLVILFVSGPEALRGCLVEVGIALGMDIKVALAGSHPSFGTWRHHPKVTEYYDLAAILRDVDGGVFQ